MKNKFLILLVVGLLAFNVGAEISKTDVNFSNLDTTSGIVSILRSKIDDINDELEAVSGGLGKAKIFYVDSAVGADTYTGTTKETALATLDAAVAKCTAGRGDQIRIMQGHAETLSGADGADIDVTGISVIGYGRGSLRPTFTLSAAASELVLGADNVSIENCRFLAATDTILKAIDVEANVDYWRIANCEFKIAAQATATEFVDTIIVNSGANDGIIEGCIFEASLCSAVSAINMASVTGIFIRNNWIQGDYSTACIESTQVVKNLRIVNNTLYNGNMAGDGGLNAVAAISVSDSSGGLVSNNLIASDVATAALMRVFDDGVFMHNWITDDDGNDFGGAWENYAASVASHTDG